MKWDIGIGEFKVSNQKSDLLKTYALGSCVAVIAYDQRRKVGGIIHIALPESCVNQDKADRLPGYFVDTGLPLFFNQIKSLGASSRDLSVKLAGGSNIMDNSGTFNIGRRNIVAVKRFLWKNGLGILREDVGGSISRTVSMEIDNGKVLLSHAGKQWAL